ncbi:GNAT family N-acetyltransferase [Pelagibaculum spongiae]|uniref:N-acetyltransferase domain-containing protein n=1 Tax=Pelagibaculum spongiae TaxID=2080658 RepID=A0A2V1GZU5_9GAMM|nr:GNAT family N-acetyltransferase [Pelagibaculum spongiae]PVZ71959.1 hypothetical protein DC094_02755 [Pelagibaculum spongiae]
MNIKLFTELTDEIETQIEQLFDLCGGYSQRVFDYILCGRDVLFCMAYQGDMLVATSIGYVTRPGIFESWVGAVHPDYRSKGIGLELQLAQHAHCQGNGIHFIETITSNDNFPMQLINLKTGMKIVGMICDKPDEIKLKFTKCLQTIDSE